MTQRDALNLVFFTHPEFVGSRSQARFAAMLVQACGARGHRVELRQPRAWLRRVIAAGPLAKWAGYVDQYLVFPFVLRAQAARDPAATLYVFCDQALGPWVPRLAHRPHVVHCHDLLALRSALGQVPENPTSWSGRLYQRWIRAGFRSARHFICISQHTRDDLLRWGGMPAVTAEVVHNGLNHPYRPLPRAEAESRLAPHGLQRPPGGVLLHVGGGQWYKNTEGVVALYAQVLAQRARSGRPLPALWMVSPPPRPEVEALLDTLPEGAEVLFCSGVDAPQLEAMYACADALLFPSLAEGFGWPIAEALACGCPVVTTGEAPMTEVGGPCALYLPRRGAGEAPQAWAARCAAPLLALLDRPEAERLQAVQDGLRWAERFQADRAIDAYLQIYRQVARGLSAVPLQSAPEGSAR